MRRISLVFACAGVMLGQVLRAQTPGDSTTAIFRPGQWGIEFLPGTTFSEAGVLRFTTPVRAWVLDGSANIDWNATSGGSGSNSNGQLTIISARFGPRWYRAVGAQAVRFVGLGISGSYGRSRDTGVATFRTQSWAAGAYGEIGMQYMLTRHFGVGGRGSVLGSHIDDQATNVSSNSTQRTSDFHLGFALQVTGTIYF